MRHRTANNAIVDIGRVDPRALDRRGNGMGSERRRWRRVEGSSIGPPDWRPRCRNKYGVPHISHDPNQIGIATRRERVGQYGLIKVVAGSVKNKNITESSKKR